MIRKAARNKITEEILASTETIQRLWKSYFFSQFDMLGRWSLTPAQLMGLRTIESHQPVTSSKLGSLLHITAGGVTQLIDSLAANGYVIRQQDDSDRRMTNICLSLTGEAIMTELNQKRRAVFIDVFSALTDDELATMADLNQKMIAQLNKLPKQKGEMS